MDMGVEEDMRERGKGGEKRKKNGRGVDGVLEKADSLNTESEPVLQEYDGKEKNKEKRDITMQEEGGEEEGEEEQIMVNLKKEGTGDDEDKNKEEDGEREGKEEVVEVEVEVEVDEECEEIGSDKDGWESEKEEEFVGGSRMSYKRLDDMFGRSNRQELKQALHKVQEGIGLEERMMGLLEISELLSMSTEESLIGSMEVVIEIAETLLYIVQSTMEVEEILLGLRGIANMIEAQPGMAGYLIRLGVARVLCGQLQQMQDIDAADQAQTTLEVLSRDFPQSVREAGGIVAGLQYIDFFTASSQRTAMRMVWNCIKSKQKLGIEQLGEVKAGLPLLKQSLGMADEKVRDVGWQCLEAAIGLSKDKQALEYLVDYESGGGAEFVEFIVEKLSNDRGERQWIVQLRIAKQAAQRSAEMAGMMIEKGIIGAIAKEGTGKNVEGHAEERMEVLELLQALLPKLCVVVGSGREKTKGRGKRNKEEREEGERRMEIVKKYSGVMEDVVFRLLIPKGIEALRNETSGQHWSRAMQSVLLGMYLLDENMVEEKDCTKESEMEVVEQRLKENSELKVFAARLMNQGQHGDTKMRIAGLLLSIKYLEMVGEEAEQMYERQGAVQVIKKLAKVEKVEKVGVGQSRGVIVEQGAKIFSRLEEIESTKRSELGEMELTKKEADEAQQWIVRASKYILNQHYLEDKKGASGQERDKEVEMMKQAEEAQRGWKEGEKGMQTVEEKVGQLVEAVCSKEGVTGYEFERSGWLKVLSEISQQYNCSGELDVNAERIVQQLIGREREREMDEGGVNVNRDMNNRCRLEMMTKLLHECLEENENLEMYDTYKGKHEGSRVGRTVTGAAESMLTRQLTVRVRGLDSHEYEYEYGYGYGCEDGGAFLEVMEEFEPMMLSVGVMAPVETVISYIKPKIHSLFQERSKKRRDAEEMGGEEKEKEKEREREKLLLQSSLASSSKRRGIRSGGVDVGGDTNRVGVSGKSTSPSLFEKSVFGAATSEEQQELLKKIAEATGLMFPELDVLERRKQQKSRDSEKDAEKKWGVEMYLVDADGNEYVLNNKESMYHSIVKTLGRLPNSKETLRPWTTTFELRFKLVESQVQENSSEGKVSYARMTAKTSQIYDGTTGWDNNKADSSKVELGKEVQQSVEVLKAIYKALSRQITTVAQLQDSSRDEPLFVSRRIGTKLQKLVDEPLLVGTKAFPSWTYALVYDAPFLFTFDQKEAFLRATILGASKSLAKRHVSLDDRQPSSTASRAYDTTTGLLGPMYTVARPKRYKVMVNRSTLVEAAGVALDKFGGKDSVLEVEFVDEVGSGLGPTLEFYSNVFADLASSKHGLWLSSSTDFLFPRPSRSLSSSSLESYRLRFEFIGRLVAKALADDRPIDLPLHFHFFKLFRNSSSSSSSTSTLPTTDIPYLLQLLHSIDPTLSASIKKLYDLLLNKDSLPNLSQTVADLCLDFTLPLSDNSSTYHLLPPENNCSPSVTLDNLEQYIRLVLTEFTFSGVQLAVDSFKSGFASVLHPAYLSVLSDTELMNLFGGCSDLCVSVPLNDGVNAAIWSIPSLLNSIRPDHGYTSSSPPFLYFVQWLSSLSKPNQRQFLKFVTGSPRLPFHASSKLLSTTSTSTSTSVTEDHSDIYLGFRALNPQLTVVQSHIQSNLYQHSHSHSHSKSTNPDDYLPTVMTCANYIKLPNYSSYEVLKMRWEQALDLGLDAFHLS